MKGLYMIDFEALLPAATLAAATQAVSGVIPQQNAVADPDLSAPVATPVVEMAQEVDVPGRP
jgi:hypothetical protein